MQKLLWSVLYLSLCITHSQLLTAQSGCPGCMINLPETLAEDTIFLSDPAVGQVNVQYDSDISFRLPKSTDPVNAVDPSTPAGVNLSRITIVDVANVPPGLIWEANKLEFDVSEETDGCVKFCGTPLQPGIYEVEVVIQARVSFINTTTSFAFPFEILPSESITDGFTIQNNTGCGETLVTFNNNVPSNGDPGISYNWNFGNGGNSRAENPDQILYDSPGTYEVNYTAIIDTVGFILNQAIIKAVDCDDFLGRPDLNLKVFDPNDEEIFLSEKFQNARLPIVIDLSTKIDTGTYRIQVIDDDSGLEGGDKICGDVEFTQLSNGALVVDGFEVEINIVNPRDTVTSSEVVVVNKIPDPPFFDTEVISNNLSTCLGDTVLLSLDTEAEDIQWYRDSLPVGDGLSNYNVTEAGNYWAIITNEFGCSQQSSSFAATFPELPNEPVFTNDRNLLTVFDESRLPEDFQLQWYLDGVIILGETEANYCIEKDGSYRLEVLDRVTGCFRSFEREATFDPAFSGCITTSTDDQLFNSNLVIYPNPSNGIFNIDSEIGDLTFTLFNSQGQMIDVQRSIQQSSTLNWSLDLTNQPEGVYWLGIQADKANRTIKLIRN